MLAPIELPSSAVASRVASTKWLRSSPALVLIARLMRSAGREKSASRVKSFFFSSRRRHTIWPRDWSSTCALPISHQLCQFHYLKDATKPLYEADQHAKTQLKKQLRGVRPIERAVEEHKTPENEAIRGYCLAVRARSEERRVGIECRWRWV